MAPTTTSPIPLYFLNSHPIQYFAPLYRKIGALAEFDLEVIFCSSHGLGGELDREFGTRVKWDIPVLEGYRSRFLKNHSFSPGIYGFWGLLNLGLIPLLFSQKRGVLVVHGWGYASNLLALLVGRLAGHTVCLRGETPACHEDRFSGWRRSLRSFFVKNLLGRLAHFCLYIGDENRRFYLRYGIPEKKLVFTPYAVDNDRFGSEADRLVPQRESLRMELGLPIDKVVVLFSGKYIPKKRPLDLLHAFAQCPTKEKAHLVFMGEGSLRAEMERAIARGGLGNVTLTGFVNQSEVSKYYAAADLFVMCSDYGETWGLSTNEAMNFQLPVLLSDRTGCCADLVEPGLNGYVFRTGDVQALAEKLDAFISMSPEQRRRMGAHSRRIIGRYSYDRIIEGLREVGRRRFPSSSAALTKAP